MAKSIIFLLVEETKGEGEDYRKVVNWERRTGRGTERSEWNLGVAGGPRMEAVRASDAR